MIDKAAAIGWVHINGRLTQSDRDFIVPDGIA
jgi:hypothetical protein